MEKYFDGKRLITYEVVSAPWFDGGRTYGIKTELTIDGKAVSHCCIDDIFCSEAQAAVFARLLAENGAEPCHLIELAQDYIS